VSEHLFGLFERMLYSWGNGCLNNFLIPQNRLFWGYLLSSLLIAILWCRFANKINLRAAVTKIFAKRAWLSRSARADYKLLLMNKIFIMLLSPGLLARSTVAYLIFDGMQEIFHGQSFLLTDMPHWIIALSFTFFLFLVDDFAHYWLHRLLHKVPLLWAFHKVHHSATTLNPLTLFRIHPVEVVLFAIRNALVQGFVTALFFFFFGNKVTLVMVLNASILTFLFNILGSNLRHSPVSIGYWSPLERIIMSPAQHHLHHSSAKHHLNKNFGVALSIWDCIFGSLHLSKKGEQLNFGLSEGQSSRHHSLKGLYLDPIHAACLVIMRLLARYQQLVKKLYKN
jgi:sterol desaturase/sphingolipid hydroxylase (fatty acid hydroxylase superfamily)